MNPLILNLIEALREELKQYGELLAQLDHQHQLVAQRKPQELAHCVAGIQSQTETVQAVRREREQHQRHIARHLRLGESVELGQILPLLPPHCGVLIEALAKENNELLLRVQGRAQQNQVLLSHAVELLKRLMKALLPQGAPTTYNGAGRLPLNNFAPTSLYEAVG
jgi:hypothetical protein